jgi:hypothetical protein
VKRSRSFLRYRRGARDANHTTIRDGLRALGHFVVDLAGVGDGVPDLCVYPRATWQRLSSRVDALATLPTPVWLEVKTAKGKMRDAQTRWMGAALNAGVVVHTARTLDEAIAAVSP